MRHPVESGTRIPLAREADVVVAGGGVSGVAAAVAAARAGASTILVEQHAYPGGVSTAGMMSSITNFYYTRRNDLVVGGIAEEVLERLIEEGGAARGPFTREYPQIPNDTEAMKLVLDRMLREAGVELLYRSTVTSARMRAGRLTHLIVGGKAQPFAISGRSFVDATGDADVVLMAGGDVEELNPNGSLEFRMANVDLDSFLEYLQDNPEEYDAYGDVETSLEDCVGNYRNQGVFHLPHGNGRRMHLIQNAISEGDYPRELGLVHGLDAFGMYGLKENRWVIINTGFINGPLLDPFFRSKAESDAREAANLAAGFLIERMPGFGNAYLAQTAPEIGVRLTRRIISDYVLSREDRESFRRFEDVVAVLTERKVGGPRYEEGFDLPFRILVPGRLSGVLSGSGKSLSVEPPGALRGQVACMQTGQAAGVGAALAARARTPPHRVDMRSVQRCLLDQGVHLGSRGRLRELGLT